MSGAPIPLSDIDDKAESIWKAIELEMRHHQDPEKMVQLWKALDEAMLAQERRKAFGRLAGSR